MFLLLEAEDSDEPHRVAKEDSIRILGSEHLDTSGCAICWVLSITQLKVYLFELRVTESLLLDLLNLTCVTRKQLRSVLQVLLRSELCLKLVHVY